MATTIECIKEKVKEIIEWGWRNALTDKFVDVNEVIDMCETFQSNGLLSGDEINTCINNVVEDLADDDDCDLSIVVLSFLEDYWTIRTKASDELIISIIDKGEQLVH